MKYFKKFFLPAGVILAVLLAFFVPEWGITLRDNLHQNILVIIIFLVCGIQTSVKDLHIDKKSILFLLGGGIFTLLILPVIAWGSSHLLAIAALPAAGLIVMAASPPTLSSGIVMTETSDGNYVTAVAITMLYNLVSVLTIPFVLALLISSDAGINTDAWNTLKKLFLLVVLPFAGGFALRFPLKGRKLPFLSYINSTAVILLVLFFFSSSSASMKQISFGFLLKSFAATVIIHMGAMAILWYAGKALKLPVSERKAYIFTAGSKTLTMALTTLAIMGAEKGDAALPCLIFYFIQMLFDSFLAAKMGLSSQEKEEEPAIEKSI